MARPARPAPGGPRPRSLEELQAELDSLVGLETVKEQVRALVAFLQVQARRKEHGLPEVATSQHLVFLGNPGTGKTTVARLLAQMYRAMGLLEKGHLVEVDRASLVGQYVGMTAIKTDRAIAGRSTACSSSTRRTRSRRAARRASTSGRSGRDAAEADGGLPPPARRDRRRLPAADGAFLDSNPGLRSRFSREIVFPDYSSDELIAITGSSPASNEYALDGRRARRARADLRGAAARRGLRQRALRAHDLRAGAERQALRLAGAGIGVEGLDPEELSRLTAEDFSAAARAVGAGAEVPLSRRRLWRRAT